ncbi:uncharacterized protein LOC117217366 [Megalopta genalis]|uniref:uncharacterized protein LOC117217366 n=1 Tax=Megalopta genalis TaxID=115081 RepID=UPI003FD37B6D
MLKQTQEIVLNIRCEILKIYCAAGRRKNMKQLINNDINLTTSTVLEKNKLELNGTRLQSFPIKNLVKQQCVQDKIISKVINISNLNDSINIKTTKVLEEQNITKPIKYEWKEKDENVIEVNESTECTTALKVEKAKVPILSEEASPLNSKLLEFSCSICSKEWKTLTELKVHIKTHSSTKPYMCEKCGQAYKRKHALEIHIGMHNGINPFQCNFCSKCFSQKVSLVRHLPMHTGETLYQCELCGKRFIHHTSYNMHKLSHSGKKSYKCHICDLSLLSTSHLKRHMRAHTGERPYSCTLCGKCFAQRYNLLAHQKLHYPFENKTKIINETQYQCSCCNLVFGRNESLQEHIRQHGNRDDKTHS